MNTVQNKWLTSRNKKHQHQYFKSLEDYDGIGRVSLSHNRLTLKAPITTAADDKFCDVFSRLSKK